jgi:endonuclease/exonuclease/phosphatase family metal-dependent hydrolase
VPVIGTTRPNPMVRLRSKLTGRNIWVFNVHNSSKNTPARQRERNAAVKIEIGKILAQRAKRIPVVFLGDMNERKVIFCKVVRQTDLRAVTGGHATKKKCVPPRTMHLDWIFVSPEFKVRSAAFDRSPQVARITDHSVLNSTTSIPGK